MNEKKKTKTPKPKDETKAEPKNKEPQLSEDERYNKMLSELQTKFRPEVNRVEQTLQLALQIKGAQPPIAPRRCIDLAVEMHNAMTSYKTEVLEPKLEKIKKELEDKYKLKFKE